MRATLFSVAECYFAVQLFIIILLRCLLVGFVCTPNITLLFLFRTHGQRGVNAGVVRVAVRCSSPLFSPLKRHLPRVPMEAAKPRETSCRTRSRGGEAAACRVTIRILTSKALPEVSKVLLACNVFYRRILAFVRGKRAPLFVEITSHP